MMLKQHGLLAVAAAAAAAAVGGGVGGGGGGALLGDVVPRHGLPRKEGVQLRVHQVRAGAATHQQQHGLAPPAPSAALLLDSLWVPWSQLFGPQAAACRPCAGWPLGPAETVHRSRGCRLWAATPPCPFGTQPMPCVAAVQAVRAQAAASPRWWSLPWPPGVASACARTATRPCAKAEPQRPAEQPRRVLVMKTESQPRWGFV